MNSAHFMAPLFILLLVLSSAQANSLSQIAARIQASGALDQNSLGDTNLWGYIQVGLQADGSSTSSLALENLSVNISFVNNRTELLVQATSSLWKQDTVSTTLVFYYDGKTLAGHLEFDGDFSAIPVHIIPSGASSWFDGLSITGNNKVSFSSQSFVDNGGKKYEKGLTFESTVEFNQKLPIAQSFGSLVNRPINTVTAELTAVFPLSESEPLAHFTAQSSSSIYFGVPDVKSTNLVLNLVASTQPDVSLSCNLQVTGLGNDGKPLNFLITADVSKQNGIAFKGALQGTWSNAFGFHWLSFQSLSVSFNSKQVSQWSFGGLALFSFIPGPAVTVTFQTDLSAGLEKVVFTVAANLANFVDIFDEVIGATPPNVNELVVSGPIQLTLATYSSSNFQKGLTLSGSVLINSTGVLYRAIRSMSANPQNLKFTFSLYVPVFSPTPEDIDFKVAEVLPFNVAKNIQFESLSLEFSITPAPVVIFSTSMDIQLGTQATFAISGKLQNEVLQFNGNMNGQWNDCFGFKWISISDATVAMVFNFSSLSLQSVSVNGDITLTFGTPSTKFQMSLGPTWDKFSFNVDVMVANAQKLFNEVLPVNAPSLTSDITLEASLTITNYASGNVAAGLTITGSALVAPDGKLAQAIKSLDPHTDLLFNVAIFLPVFSQNPGDVSFTLSEQGDLPITNSIKVTGFTFTFDVTPTPQVTLDTKATILLNKNQQPLSFDLNGKVDGSGSMSLSGALIGGWERPFGMSWLLIKDFSAQFSFSESALASLDFSGHAALNFSSSKSDVAITGSTGNNFKDVTLEVDDTTVVSLGHVLVSLGTPNAVVSELSSLTNTISVVLSTYTHGSVREGLTLEDQVTVTGGILEKLKALNINDKFTFSASVYIPVFAGQSPDVEITLNTPAVQLGPDARLTGLQITLDTTPLEISVQSGFAITFDKNPELDFILGGQYQADGTVELNGELTSEWDNLFGIKHFNVHDVAGAVAFNSMFCEVDFCLSGLGVGFNLSIGSELIYFYGYAELPNVAKIFFEAGLSGQNAYGLALSFQNLLIQWDHMVGVNSIFYINPTDVPADWGLENMAFYIAPEAGTFDNKHYDAGFWFMGGFRLIGIDCDVNVLVSDSDVHFNVHISLDTFQQYLSKELHLAITQHPEDFPSWTAEMREQLFKEVNGLGSGHLVTVKNVSISDFSLVHLAVNDNNPLFYMEYSFLGHHHFTTQVPLLHWYQEFHHFFEVFLKSLFS